MTDRHRWPDEVGRSWAPRFGLADLCAAPTWRSVTQTRGNRALTNHSVQAEWPLGLGGAVPVQHQRSYVVRAPDRPGAAGLRDDGDTLHVVQVARLPRQAGHDLRPSVAVPVQRHDSVGLAVRRIDARDPGIVRR